jgi:hypothetical protein
VTGRIGLACLLALAAAAPTIAQAPPRAPAPFRLQGCLHEMGETAAERARRTDALNATRLINNALGRLGGAAYPSWEALADSPVVTSLRSRDVVGPAGELARKMVWGSDEPLTAWRSHYVAQRDAYAFSLRDLRDPCNFTYASDDTAVIVEGYPLGATNRVVPLGG